MIKLIAMILPILFILIIVYGSGEDRVRSATLLFLYTFAGSLPMLLAILTTYSYVGSTDFAIISLSEINLEYQNLLFCCFFIAFAVKTPALHSGKMFLWDKLSNSGKILKHIVPNYIRKHICG
jgi:NADH:ubiquinone oxidoreductase subunit 4 (subunit M)